MAADERSGFLDSKTVKAVGLVAAIVTILTFFVAGFGGDEDDESTPTSPTTPTTAPTTPTTEPTSPTTPPTTAPSTTASPTTAPESPITIGEAEPTRVGTGIRLSERFSIDLDSTAADWGISEDLSYRTRDLGFYSDTINGPNVFYVVYKRRTSPVEGERSLSACSSPSLERNELFWVEVEAGDSFCIETGEDGIAWIDVVEYGDSRSSVTIDVYYWQGS